MAKKNKDTCLSCNEARRRNDVRSCRILIVVAGENWLSPCGSPWIKRYVTLRYECDIASACRE